MKNERHSTPADFSAYLDGRLAGAGREGFEAHLAGCAECGRRLKELETLRSLLKDLPEVDPGPGFERAILERARERGRRYAFAAWYRRTAYGLAGLGLILIVAIYLQRPAPLMETDHERMLEVQPSESPAPVAPPLSDGGARTGFAAKPKPAEPDLESKSDLPAVGRKEIEPGKMMEAVEESAGGRAAGLTKAEVPDRPAERALPAPAAPSPVLSNETAQSALEARGTGGPVMAPRASSSRSVGPAAGAAGGGADESGRAKSSGAAREMEVIALEGANRTDTLAAPSGADTGLKLARSRAAAAPANLLIRNSRDWSRLWQTQNTVQNLSLPLPPVDFKKQMVVAVPTRQENRAYQVLRSEEKADRVIIYYRDVTTEKCDKDEAPPEPPYQVQVVNVRSRVEFQKAP